MGHQSSNYPGQKSWINLMDDGQLIEKYQKCERECGDHGKYCHLERAECIEIPNFMVNENLKIVGEADNVLRIHDLYKLEEKTREKIKSRAIEEPQPLSVIEQNIEVYDKMRIEEESQRIRPDYLAYQKEINYADRNALMATIMGMYFPKKLFSTRALFKAVDLINYILSVKKIHKYDYAPANIIMTYITVAMLDIVVKNIDMFPIDWKILFGNISKWCERWDILRGKDTDEDCEKFSEYTMGTFNEISYQTFELIQPHLNTPTTWDFILVFLPELMIGLGYLYKGVSPLRSWGDSQEIMDKVLPIAADYVPRYESLKFKPSIQAASILCVANASLNPDESNLKKLWPEYVEKRLELQFEEIRECVMNIIDIVPREITG